MSKYMIPISEKNNLTVKEAAAYFNLGENKIRELTKTKDCPFVLWDGNRRLIKRRLFEKYINNQFSI